MKKSSLLRERFVREMQIRNYSEQSIEAYTASLAKLAQFFNLSPDRISTEQFKDFLHHRIAVDGISVSMVNQTISAYKILQKDVLGLDWEQIRIKRPRREKKLPVALSTEEIARMIARTRNIKHKALLALAYSSGLRRDELRKLKPADIDSELMRIHVAQGKGKMERYTLLSRKALDLLRFYYKIYRPAYFLFEPQQEKGNCLAPETINHIAKQAAEKAGIKKKISFHTLRYSFATHLLEKASACRSFSSIWAIPRSGPPRVTCTLPATTTGRFLHRSMI